MEKLQVFSRLREWRKAVADKARYARKFRQYERTFLCGRWTELQLQQRMQALTAFVLPADSRAYRLHVFDRFGVVAKGLEPRESRGQLEQQRQELPVSEPQQQLARQQEQQLGVPGCPGPSSIATLDDEAMDPAAILSGIQPDDPGKEQNPARCW